MYLGSYFREFFVQSFREIGNQSVASRDNDVAVKVLSQVGVAVRYRPIHHVMYTHESFTAVAERERERQRETVCTLDQSTMITLLL